MKKINYFLSTIFASLLLLASLQVTAQNPEITLIQPTEPGIEWTVGGEYLISWVDNFSGTVDIILVKGGGDIATLATGISESTWSWDTDGLATGNDYQIRVQSSTNSNYNSPSLNPFSLVDQEGGLITINQPTSADTWIAGSEYLISWNDNLDEPVKVELFNSGGGPIETISSSTTATTLSWTVTNGLVGDDFYIKVSSTIAGSTTLPAESDVFSIASSSGTFTKVLQPNAWGTEWAKGTNHLISWNDDLEEVVVELMVFEEGSTWDWVPYTGYSGISGNPTIETTLNWDIPNGLPIGDYKIRVRSTDGSIEDLSNNTFEITNITGTFTQVLQPNAWGTEWAKGTNHLISWNDDLEEVVVELMVFEEGSTWDWVPYTGYSGISGNPTIETTLNWDIPNGLPIGDYKIRVRSTDGSIEDLSNNTFEITNITGTFTQVLQPNAWGTEWAKGTNHLISWNDDLEEVVVELMVFEEGSTWDWVPYTGYSGISGNPTIETTLNWDIPNGLPIGDYKIRVRSTDGSIEDLSNNTFEINAVVGTFTQVLQPSDWGIQWQQGTNHIISWNDDLEEVVVELMVFEEGSTWDWVPYTGYSGISGNPTIETTLNWDIPNGLPIGDYKIRVRSTDGSIEDLSNNTFEINAVVGTFTQVLQPSDWGIQWAQGTNHLISWNDDLEEVVVELMVFEEGSTWDWVPYTGYSGISGNPTIETTLNWDIPNGLPIGDYKIRVRSTDGSIEDLSNNTFEIIQQVTMSAYPNPADQNFTLSVDNTKGEFTVQLYDRYNNRVIETVGNTQISNKVKISTSELNDGVYFMIVTSNNERTTKKIVVNHK